jgi:hypothetical protein
MGMENHGGMITGENSNFIHQSSLEILAAKSSSSKAGGTNEGNYEFCFMKYLFQTSKGSSALLPL